MHRVFPAVVVSFLLLTALPALADGDAGLAVSPRAHRLLAIARKYLPGDWRWPSTNAPVSENMRLELATLLPVTPREQRTGYSCGAASLGIMLSAHGLHMPDKKLEKLTGTTKEGIDPQQIVDAGRKLGFAVTEKFDATEADVAAELAAGNPVLIDFQASYGPDDEPGDDWGHYSIVVACDAKDFLVVDPSEVNPAQLRRIPRKSLAKVWWDTFIADGKRFAGWMMTMTRPAPGGLAGAPETAP